MEKIGIERSLQAAEKAELVILVLDASRQLNEEDEKLLELTKDKERIIVYNKSDLNSDVEGLSVSAIHNQIDELVQEIRRRYEKGLIMANADPLNNERQIGLALQADSIEGNHRKGRQGRSS